jgi:hypothetical protein
MSAYVVVSVPDDLRAFCEWRISGAAESERPNGLTAIDACQFICQLPESATMQQSGALWDAAKAMSEVWNRPHTNGQLWHALRGLDVALRAEQEPGERQSECLAEEVARLHGFVGPDGRGRP